MKSNNQTESTPANIWIAEDPTQPGTAFAVQSAAESSRKYVQEALDEWMRVYGVKGRLVNREDGLRMLEKWDRVKSSMDLKDEKRARLAEAAHQPSRQRLRVHTK